MTLVDLLELVSLCSMLYPVMEWIKNFISTVSSLMSSKQFSSFESKNLLKLACVFSQLPQQIFFFLCCTQTSRLWASLNKGENKHSLSTYELLILTHVFS